MSKSPPHIRQVYSNSIHTNIHLHSPILTTLFYPTRRVENKTQENKRKAKCQLTGKTLTICLNDLRLRAGSCLLLAFFVQYSYLSAVGVAYFCTDSSSRSGGTDSICPIHICTTAGCCTTAALLHILLHTGTILLIMNLGYP